MPSCVCLPQHQTSENLAYSKIKEFAPVGCGLIGATPREKNSSLLL